MNIIEPDRIGQEDTKELEIFSPTLTSIEEPHSVFQQQLQETLQPNPLSNPVTKASTLRIPDDDDGLSQESNNELLESLLTMMQQQNE